MSVYITEDLLPGRFPCVVARHELFVLVVFRQGLALSERARSAREAFAPELASRVVELLDAAGPGGGIR